ncbi:MAG: hypothetical protein NC924_04790, partial [Candidatus Omnitrophica bacterium]|nr:hypothetical protein [Candidatus Omnitrophota bacterium]
SLTWREIADELGVKQKIVKDAFARQGVQSLFYKGKEYPLSLLVPDKQYAQLQVRDVLREYIREQGLGVEELSDHLVAIMNQCQYRRGADELTQDQVKKIIRAFVREHAAAGDIDRRSKKRQKQDAVLQSI